MNIAQGNKRKKCTDIKQGTSSGSKRALSADELEQEIQIVSYVSATAVTGSSSENQPEHTTKQAKLQHFLFPSECIPSDRIPYNQLSSAASSRASPSDSRGNGITNPSTSSCPQQQKKQRAPRKLKRMDAPLTEKRASIFKKSPPKSILERLNRVHQGIFVLERRRDGFELREEFDVFGSTGNVYTVIIDRIPSCTCPDAQKGNHCKHILFIYCRVLHVPQTSTSWYQKSLLHSELEQIFTEAPLAPLQIHQGLRDAYLEATGRPSTHSQTPSDEVGGSIKRKVLAVDEECAVCYSSMKDGQASYLEWCDTCGNALHKECFRQWSQAKRGMKLTCVYCRATWPASASVTRLGANEPARSREGYINLGSAAGINTIPRDTSTYYHGPRRGQRYYGYQEYEE